MRVRQYDELGGTMSFVGAGMAVVAALAALGQRERIGRDPVAGMLTLGVLGGCLLAIGNRLALASLDRAERVRWTGGDESDVGARMAGSSYLEPLPACTGAMEAEPAPNQTPRPLKAMRGAARL